MKMIQKVIYPLLLSILLISLFLGLGDQVLYAKSGIGRIVPFILIFGGIPFSIYKTLLVFYNKKSASNLAALSILILGPAFGLWSKYISETDFKKYGKITYGTVVERKWTSLNNRGRWTITAEFEYNSKKYITFTKDDNDSKYRIHDQICVRFSTRNPENNEILIN